MTAPHRTPTTLAEYLDTLAALIAASPARECPPLFGGAA